eukprot:CAMPEP_0115135336 /NCGR_PEP_ID=MMETSP0227-20121206/55664_1 /TAXON_ID=89957 /ORGANISM="Polarella glacialis, Strain CCMP 1383" /LENGTH=356 /DNA_ID=CAMNT_0002542053 /DNA_START=90 /DNA_END=1161 /DNA_ORIENTATION=+
MAMAAPVDCPISEQENRPPTVAVSVSHKQVRTPAPSPQRGPVGFPVKNTFIHYGTPIMRTPNRAMATPKTVPPNFAPEAEAAAAAGLRTPVLGVWSAGRPPVPDWPADLGLQMQQMQQMQQMYHMPQPMQTMPQHMQTMPQPMQPMQPMLQPMQPMAHQAQSAASGRATGAGIAPLRLFDFLPSPKVQPESMQHFAPMMPPPMPLPSMVQMPLQPVPGAEAPFMMAAPLPPLPQLGPGTAGSAPCYTAGPAFSAPAASYCSYGGAPPLAPPAWQHFSAGDTSSVPPPPLLPPTVGGCTPEGAAFAQFAGGYAVAESGLNAGAAAFQPWDSSGAAVSGGGVMTFHNSGAMLAMQPPQ